MDMFVGIHLDLWWTFPGHKKISWRKKKGNLGKQRAQFSTWDNVDSYIAAILGALRYTARVSVSTTDLQHDGLWTQAWAVGYFSKFHVVVSAGTAERFCHHCCFSIVTIQKHVTVTD